MKNLDKNNRLSGYSLAEITTILIKSVVDLRAHYRFNDSQLEVVHMLNALSLWFLKLDEAERVRFAGYWLARVELMLCETDEERAKYTRKVEDARQAAAPFPSLPLVIEKARDGGSPAGDRPVSKPAAKAALRDTLRDEDSGKGKAGRKPKGR